MKITILLLLPFLGLVTSKATGNGLDDVRSKSELDINGETAYTNFIKVMATILITTPEPPREITESVKVVMRDLMNGEPVKEGYFSYMTTSILRVFDSPLKNQVDNMFTIIISMTDPRSKMNMASKTVQDFLMSRPEGEIVYEDIEKYVKNLFQPAVTTPGINSDTVGNAPSDFLGRPASGRRPMPNL